MEFGRDRAPTTTGLRGKDKKSMPAPAQVFISYAHADNPDFDDDTKPWVTNFVDHLQKAVGMRAGGGRVECWMDQRLEPQHAVDATLRERIQSSKCIVAFLSPRYLESEWCRKEMATFVESVGGGTANDRVFLVELRPTEREQWHPGIRSITAMKFWASSLGQPAPMILGWPAPDPKADRPYWTLLNRLADILAKQILSILPEAPTSVPAAAVQPKLIWVADPTDDVLEYWETLATGLRDLGHGVAPNAALSYPRKEEISYRQAMASDLAKADLLVQLFGHEPGEKPAWADLRFVQLQAQAARAEAQCRDLPLLAWRTPDIRLEEIADPAYEALLTGAIACGFEEFRQQVLRQLAPPAAPPKAPARSDSPMSVVVNFWRALRKKIPLRGRSDSLMSVVVNADEPDRDLGKRVRDMLFDLEVDVTLLAEPLLTQVPALYFRDLKTQLAASNGLVIVYGAAQPSWVQAQHALARKTLALSRKGVWGAVLDGPPEKKPDHEVRSRSLMLLDCRRGVTPDPLKRFVDTLRQEAARV